MWWKQNDRLSLSQKSKPAMKESFIELMQHLLDQSPKEVVFPLNVEDGPQNVALPKYGYHSTCLSQYGRYFKSPFEGDRSKLSVEWDKCILNPAVGIKERGGKEKEWGISKGMNRGRGRGRGRGMSPSYF